MVSKKAIIDYYDQLDNDYRTFWYDKESLALHYGYWNKTTKSRGQALLNMNRILAKKAKITKNDTVLDAGCGVGGSSIWLARTFGCRVVGITLSPKQVKLARQNAKQRGVNHLVKFQVGDFTATKLPSTSFDVVWALESVCYAEDKADYIREAYRLLKPGGRFILADGFQRKKHLPEDEQKLMNKWLRGWALPNLAVPGEFESSMKKRGFKQVTFRDISKNILPSAKRMYHLSLVGTVLVGKPAELLKLRSKVQTGNVTAMYCQYKIINKRIMVYKIFYGQK